MQLENNWREQYIVPLVRAAVARDDLGLASARAEARAALTGATLSADAKLALDLMVCYITAMEFIAGGDTAGFSREAPMALAHIERAKPLGPESDFVRRSCHMQLQIVCALHGLTELARDDFRALIATVPENERQTEQWHHITCFAFVSGDFDPIRIGYEAFLEDHSTYYANFLYRRYDVMNKIIQNRAARIDVELLIDECSLPGHIREVAQLFWPRFRELGLIDANLERKLQGMLTALCP